MSGEVRVDGTLENSEAPDRILLLLEIEDDTENEEDSC
jgi:hypothetical protein